MKLLRSDIETLRAAASLAAHAPEKMRAAHLAPRLEALARRLEAEVHEEPETGVVPLQRAA